MNILVMNVALVHALEVHWPKLIIKQSKKQYVFNIPNVYCIWVVFLEVFYKMKKKKNSSN